MTKVVVHGMLIVVLLVQFCASVSAAANNREYTIKAAVIGKIVNYIEWPQESDEPLVIMVYGKNPYATILEDMYVVAQKKIKNRLVKVVYAKSLHDIKDCDIVFIAQSERKHLNHIISHLSKKSILTVADSKGFGLRGVHINFYKSKNKIKFEINEARAVKDGFKVNYRLRKIAKIIGGSVQKIEVDEKKDSANSDAQERVQE